MNVITKMKRKENPLKTNLISISLDEEKGKKTSHQTYNYLDKVNTGLDGEEEKTGLKNLIESDF